MVGGQQTQIVKSLALADVSAAFPRLEGLCFTGSWDVVRPSTQLPVAALIKGRRWYWATDPVISPGPRGAVPLVPPAGPLAN